MTHPRRSASGPKPKAPKPKKTAATPVKAKAKRTPPKPKLAPVELTPWQKWSANPEAAISELCDHIVAGGHLAEFVKTREINYTTVLQWLDKDSARAEMYARAREDRSDKLADEIIAISDDSKNDTYVDPETGQVKTDHEVVARAKLRVDARKWVASKLKPRVYGDKLDVTQSVTIKDVSDDDLIRRAAKFGLTITLGQAPQADGSN